MIRFAAIVIVLIFAVIGYWFADPARAKNVAGVFDNLINQTADIEQDVFEFQALEAINERRQQLNLAALSTAPEIQDALARFGASQRNLADTRLKDLFANLQSEFPGAQYLSATVLLDPRDDGLFKSIAKWEDAGNPQYATLSTLAFRDGLRKGCIAVLARQLPPFDLEAANREGGRFFQRCPHCGSAHAVMLDRKSQTLILACPDCQKPYDVLAADTHEQFRRATDFLEGFRLPGIASTPTPNEDSMLAIWSAVLRHCRYEYDNTSMKRGEAWKKPSETWKDAAGDCEDTSILLADALASAGIESRVAVGWNIHIGQHAWCVAKIGNQQWVLESTLQLKADQTPELRTVADAAEEYQPEQLFDRQHLYFRNDGKERAGCDDYWADSRWETMSVDR
ncbi:MAG: hypothetical protein KDN19_03895 [Verrucomicrobiae bacterium]|nr:hypothetical protein [Verrucomicrobiae bacterium]